jgi:hypothetical protein
MINEYDQSNIYEVTEILTHDDSKNEYPYANTFTNLNDRLEDELYLNNIAYFVKRFGKSINIDDRGTLIDSDIMGTDLIDALRDEFKRGFNNIFYGIGNYTYDYTLTELDEQQRIKFLRDSLVKFDSLNKMLNSFLRYNFISTNSFLYTIDSDFRMGFFTKTDDENLSGDNLFTN